MKVQSESEVAQSCPTLSDPMVCIGTLWAPPSMGFSSQEYWSGASKLSLGVYITFSLLIRVTLSLKILIKRYIISRMD